MINIWGFLTQTLQVSSMAAVLLLIKAILKDKLPPRWQYGVWGLLAVIMVVPAGKSGMYIFRGLHVYLQAAKTMTETKLNSRYTVAESVAYNTSFLPRITGGPVSITDILFVVYTAGVVLCIVRYVISYCRLGFIIGRAQPDKAFQQQTDAVAAEYGLKSCRVKAVGGLTSAFVYGIFRPVLVLPVHTATDDKVTLHELLHLKYKDLLQKVVWSFFRALHWPNPFMQLVFNVINNDMETLCDSRVLERLEGERRRDYGRILLSMINEKYPSAFGTTSVSNGSVFIAERIKTIARFKKYPQGMGIVAGCIIAMLFPLTVRGESSSDEITGFNLAKEGFDMQLQIEECRMTSCGTVAGAIDVYAKAVFDVEEFMLAVQPTTVNPTAYAVPDRSQIWGFGSDHMYYVVNMKQLDENTYTAGIMFKNYDDDSSDGEYGTHYYIIPVKIIRENGWKVYQTGDYQYYYLKNVIDSTYSPPATEDYTGVFSLTHNTEYGKLRVVTDNISWFTQGELGTFYFAAKPNAQFTQSRGEIQVFLEISDKCLDSNTVAVGIGTSADFDTDRLAAEYLSDGQINMSTNGPGGYYSLDNKPVEAVLKMDGVMMASLIYDVETISAPETIQIDIWLDKQKVETVKIDVLAGEIVG